MTLKRAVNLVIIFTISLILFVIYVSYNNAESMTQFYRNIEPSPKFSEMTLVDTIDVMMTGLKKQRPENQRSPMDVGFAFETHEFDSASKYKIHSWYIPNKKINKPLIILYHGYCGRKEQMLKTVELLADYGYGFLLIDFYGSGDSSGDNSSIGWKESFDVLASVEFAKTKLAANQIILYGTSMGAAAIIKALHDNPEIGVDAVILQSSFQSFYGTVNNRFKLMGVPSFPLAQCITYFFGLINDFDAFDFEPVKLASKIKLPVLLLAGENDRRAPISEQINIFKALSGKKEMHVFKNVGHRYYPDTHSQEFETVAQNWISRNFR